MLYTIKHAPKKIEGMIGNEEAKLAILTWAREWERNNSGKPLLLHGPTGVGKTLAAYCLASEFDWQMVETNASNLRDKESVQKLLGLSSGSMSLFGGKRLILFDEVDSAFDRGEVAELTKVLKESRQPIVLTANDIWGQKFAPIRVLCAPIQFRAVNSRSVKNYLSRIASEEKIGDGLVEQIGENAGGDLRRALIDLQSGMISLTDKKIDSFKTVASILKAKSFADAKRAADESQTDFDMLYWWIEENIPVEFEKHAEVAKALDYLSKADVFLGRIRRRQNYRYFKYAIALATAGVSSAKDGRYSKFVKYNFPSYIKKLSSTKASRALVKEAGKKIRAKLHCSIPQAIESIKTIGGGQEYFGLSDEERILFYKKRERKEKPLAKATILASN
ncbi:replication factor C large subunit [Candidatus Micrarchaeota archaeon]|nr:replication factor C large subunit [Candidatus Micrarchaeota archaeon]